jgi:hypothetical protein
MFIAVRQKEISGLLKCLWQGDMFKVKWTLLARAYSVIRDFKGKAAAPLDQFLAINAPFIGIIAPGEYLGLFRWELQMDEQQKHHMSRRFTPAWNSFDEKYIRTDHSLQDILQHCEEQGYVSSGELPKLQHNILAARPSSRTRVRTANPAQDILVNDIQDPVAPQSTNKLVGIQSEVDSASVQPMEIAQVAEEGLVATLQSYGTDDSVQTPVDVSVDDETLSRLLSHYNENVQDGGTLPPSTPGHNLAKDSKASSSVYPHSNLFRDNPLADLNFDPLKGDAYDAYDLQTILDNEDLGDPKGWGF